MAKSKVPSKKPKAVKNKKVTLRRKKNQPEEIVIDRQAGLIFKSENELFDHFQKHIDYFENEFNAASDASKVKEEFSDDQINKMEDYLDLTLDEPQEIWHDDKTFKEFPVFYFIRPIEDLNAFHVAATYVSSDDEPTFIFFHFLTREIPLVDKFRKGDLVYDRSFEEVGFGAVPGDSLSDSDPLSIGLFISMLKVRADSDVAYEKFLEIGEELREDTIENADEIWRTTDLNGHNMVTFIKEFPDHEVRNLSYVAVTLEDPSSQVHTLLFSFPTNDENLLDRYRHGENLQADDVQQESSH